jgi:5-methylcytosine-specific restriction endonuclease McrA
MREAALKKGREWDARNPIRVQVIAVLKELPKVGDPTEAINYGVCLRYDPCAYCGTPAETIDHVDPKRRGGTSDWWNLTATCRDCNKFKYTDSLLIFLLHRNRIKRVFAPR